MPKEISDILKKEEKPYMMFDFYKFQRENSNLRGFKNNFCW